MKPIKKISLDKLTKEEEKQLVGGSTNKNTVSDCKCSYYDGPSARNVNKEGGCSCTCTF